MRTGFFACVSILIALSVVYSDDPAELDATQKKLIQAADVIVVARITREGGVSHARGMKDSEVEAKAAKAIVETTLKGQDHAGIEISVRISSKRIEKDKTYIFFLLRNRSSGELSVFSYEDILMGATEENLAAVKKEIAAQDGKIQKNLIKIADLIVAAKITRDGESEAKGMMDSEIEAKAPKAIVETTLKGQDHAGIEISICISSKLIEKDKTYIFFLYRRRGGSGRLDPIEDGNPMGATEENLGVVKKEIAAQGWKVSPKRVMWMVEGTGNGPSTRYREFIVFLDGDFEWTVRNEHRHPITNEINKEMVEKITGKVPKDKLADLVVLVKAGEEQPGIADAGSVSFEFLDDKGKLQHRSWSVSRGKAPYADMMAVVEEIVKAYGKAADIAPTPASGPSTVPAKAP
ncbi:MAG: hypothetical protein HZA50_00910 [Planctomycetes bacterium]|nr:hypothetical protein [Planctomycetota bacterium]